MPKAIDLTGEKFGRWTVLQFAGWDESKQWLCRCECGTERVVTGRNLRSGASYSCGCWNLEQIRQPKKHGMAKTSEFRIWCMLLGRCYRETDPAYANYGGRGIRVCKRWRDSFKAFYADMGPRPKGLTIERIDNDGDYKPSNCRWATNREQQRNKRTNRYIEAFGKRQILQDWARELKTSASLLHYHLKQGRTLEQLGRCEFRFDLRDEEPYKCQDPKCWDCKSRNE